MYCLYWIRLEDHTDKHSTGYIGITTDFTERMRSHKKSRKATHINYAINKYGWDNLTKEVLLEGLTKEDALFLERLYRPECSIGWNSHQGGNLGVESSWYSVENKDKHRSATSTATIKGIVEKDFPSARSYRAKESWRKSSITRRKLNLGEGNPKAKLTDNDVREIKYKHIPDGLTNSEIAVMYNVKHYVISFIRNGKTWKHV